MKNEGAITVVACLQHGHFIMMMMMMMTRPFQNLCGKEKTYTPGEYRREKEKMTTENEPVA